MGDIVSARDPRLAGCDVRRLVCWDVVGPSDRRGPVTAALVGDGYRVELRFADEARFGLTAYATAAAKGGG